MIKLSQKQINAYEARVDTGIAWLDKRAPDWAQKVDDSRLNLRSCSVCILGSVFENFWEIVYKRDDSPTKALSYDESIALGFAEPKGDVVNYDLLTFIWQRKIAALKKATAAA